MEHVGIDLGATRSHIVVMSAAGDVIERVQVETPRLPSWLAGKGTPARVVMEACTQSPAIARASQTAGHITVVVPSNVVRALGVGARGIKTDDRDAEVLARASVRNSELTSVHLRSELSRSRREFLVARAMLVDNRKQIALSVKSWLRGRLIRLKGRGSTLAFCAAVRRVALESPEGLPIAIEIMLESFEHLTAQIKRLDEQIAEIADADPVCARLRTMPGVGAVIALAFTTHIDEISRFESAEQLASYMALVPGEATTGGKTMRTATIKAGPTHLKSLLVQSAWAMWRFRPHDPVVLWARAIAEKRGRRIAIVALARKLVIVLHAMWTRGTTYDPSRAARPRSSPSSATASNP